MAQRPNGGSTFQGKIKEKRGKNYKQSLNLKYLNYYNFHFNLYQWQYVAESFFQFLKNLWKLLNDSLGLGVLPRVSLGPPTTLALRPCVISTGLNMEDAKNDNKNISEENILAWRSQAYQDATMIDCETPVGQGIPARVL